MDWIIPSAWALVTLGLVAAVIDLVVGTAGLLATVGVVLLVAGVGIAFTHSLMFGITVLAAATILAPLAGWVLARVFPWTPLGRSMLVRSASVDETASSFPALQDLDMLEGRLGTTRSYLRPSGVVEFDGRRIDCITEGMMVEPDRKVRCLNVHGGRVLVRPVDPGEEAPLSAINSDLFELESPPAAKGGKPIGDG